MKDYLEQAKPLVDALEAVRIAGLDFGAPRIASALLLGTHIRIDIQGLPVPGENVSARARNATPYLAVAADDRIFFCGTDNVTCRISSATEAARHVLRLATGGYAPSDRRTSSSFVSSESVGRRPPSPRCG